MVQEEAHIHEVYKPLIISSTCRIKNGIDKIFNSHILAIRKFLVMIMWFTFFKLPINIYRIILFAQALTSY